MSKPDFGGLVLSRGLKSPAKTQGGVAGGYSLLDDSLNRLCGTPTNYLTGWGLFGPGGLPLPQHPGAKSKLEVCRYRDSVTAAEETPALSPARLKISKAESGWVKGLSVPGALQKVGRSRSWYGWEKDPNGEHCSKQCASRRLNTVKARAIRAEVEGFADFRQRFLNSKTYPHQQAWVDVLEVGS